MQKTSGLNGGVQRVSWRKWSRRSLVVLVVLASLMSAALTHVLHSLDEPWIKRYVVERARVLAGLEIDYRSARVDVLSGARIDGLRVSSPAALRAFAPDLAQVERIEARWSVGNLLFGHHPPLDDLALHGAAVTVVMDEAGRTSFDLLFPSPVPPPPKPTPLSHQAASFLGSAPPLAHATLDDVNLALVRTDHGAVLDRSELHGLGLALSAAPAPAGTRGWELQAGLGSTPVPLEVSLSRQPTGAAAQTARARFSLTVDATSSDVTTALDLRMLEQTFAASVAADHWLHAEAAVHFDPSAGMTQVRIERTLAGDGAATLDAAIDLPDAGDPSIREAHGDVDGARLLRWLPAGLAPVTAERAQLHYQVDALVLGSPAHLSTGGSAAVEASLGHVAVEVPGGPLLIRDGKLSVRATPREASGMAAKGTLTLGGTEMGPAAARTSVGDLTLDLDGAQTNDGVIDGHLGLSIADVARTSPGAQSVALHDAKAALEVHALHPMPDAPLTTTGDVTLAVDVGTVEAKAGAADTKIDHLELRTHLPLAGHAPFTAEVDLRAARLRALAAGGRPMVDAPVHLDLRAHDVQPDSERPVASRGVVAAKLELGDAEIALEATKEADAADFRLQAAMKTLSQLRPLVSPALGKSLPLDRMALTVKSQGRVTGLAGAPGLQQATELHLDRPAFAPVAASALDLSLKSRGTPQHQQIDLDLRATKLVVEGAGPASDDHLTLGVTLDRLTPSLQFTLLTEGRAATKLSGAFSFAAARSTVDYQIDGHLGGLAPLAPLAAKMPGLEGFDLSQLEVTVGAHGSLLGAVTAVSADGAVAMAPDPMQTAELRGSADLAVKHFHWAKGDTAVITPEVTWHGDMSGAMPRRTLVSHLTIPSVHLDVGIHDIDVNGINDQSEGAFLGNLADPDIELKQRLSIRAVEQTMAPEYPLGDLAFALGAERSPDGVIHVSELKLANGAGGTTLALSGNVDLGEGRRTLSLTSALTQDLARLSAIPDRFKGTGKLAVESNVISPDFVHYRVRSLVKGEAVTVNLPKAGVAIENANGEVPVAIALQVGPDGVALERTERRAGFSMLRFADQHPLLTRSGVLSIGKLTTPLATISPLVGNLEIDENVISLRQFEMGVRGGTITGLCGVDWEGPKSTLELHVRASGVQSSHGEPFDGNLAVAISAADRTIDGRAEIIKIGKRHLLDLLDLEDPQHADAGMNRIRTALAFGYPDSLRLVFDHGFANAHLELGGIARLVSIGDLRGIPMGPIVDKMIAKMRAGSDGGDPQ